MSTLLTVVTGALLFLAAALALLSAVGLMRFRSVYARSHPITKAITLGVVAVCIAAAVQVDDPSDTAKLLLVAGFQVLTAPISAHLVARAAYRSGSAGSGHMRVDEMQGVEFQQERGSAQDASRTRGPDATHAQPSEPKTAGDHETDPRRESRPDQE